MTSRSRVWRPSGAARHFDFSAQPSLHPLIAKTRGCRSAGAIADHAIDHIRQSFGTKSCAVILVDDKGNRGPATRGTGISDEAYDDYEANFRAEDRVLGAVIERQTVVAKEEIWNSDEFRESTLFRGFGQKHDLFHYMIAPIYGMNGLLGVTYFCRAERQAPFSRTEHDLASALAGYLSAAMACVPSVERERWSRTFPQLTPREAEVAALVVNGESNPEIAAALRIARETVKQTLRRVYRKLDVNGRAQMAARLAVGRLPDRD